MAQLLHGSATTTARTRAEFQIPLVLPGHTSEPVPFDGEPTAAPLSRVRENTPLLDEDRSVEKVAGGASPTPENYGRIVGLNRAGQQPEGDPTDPGAGDNRCAAG